MKQQEKKTWAKPALIEHGDVERITLIEKTALKILGAGDDFCENISTIRNAG